MDKPDAPDNTIKKKLEALEERLARIEDYLRLTPIAQAPADAETAQSSAEVEAGGEASELEFELGQNWFAKVGIVVIALGIVFLLTFPYRDLPPAAPGLFGYVLAGGLFLIAHLWRESFDLLSRYLRGAGIALLFFTTLRLFFFGDEPVLSNVSVPGVLLLLAVLSINTLIALGRRSPYLFSLAMTTGFATAVAVGTTWFMLPLITTLCLLGVYARLRYDWSGVLLFTTVLAYLTHCVWMLNNPILGNEIAIVTPSLAGFYIVLGYAVLLGAGTFFRRDLSTEGFGAIVNSFINGGMSYGLFLLHTMSSLEEGLVESHLFASLVFLGMAIAFWVREQSRYSTFAYAMLGYVALSVAIVKLVSIPGMFVWLSLQSILVVATAVWFRSRFIVVANFVIYLIIIAGYLIVPEEETGISLGFGVVALASARILNWQKDRLELKTEFMRNAYLVSAFAVFPYALYHLVPHDYVSLSWVGVALFYYLMNLVIKAQKYRWMGHMTLLLTVLYVLVIGIVQLEPVYRILSFLVLGSALLVVSLIFTRMRRRRREVQPAHSDVNSK